MERFGMSSSKNAFVPMTKWIPLLVAQQKVSILKTN